MAMHVASIMVPLRPTKNKRMSQAPDEGERETERVGEGERERERSDSKSEPRQAAGDGRVRSW